MSRPTSLRACALAMLASLVVLAPIAHAGDAGPAARAVSHTIVSEFQSGMLPTMRDGNASAAAIQCIETMDPDAFAPKVQEMMDEALTPVQRAEYDAYAQSALGQRELATVTSQLARSAGLDVPAVAPLTPDEMAGVDAFSSKPHISRFADELMASMEAVDTDGTLGTQMSALARDCMSR